MWWLIHTKSWGKLYENKETFEYVRIATLKQFLVDNLNYAETKQKLDQPILLFTKPFWFPLNCFDSSQHLSIPLLFPLNTFADRPYNPPVIIIEMLTFSLFIINFRDSCDVTTTFL